MLKNEKQLLSLSSDWRKAFLKAGYKNLTPVQEAVIPVLCKTGTCPKDDIIVAARTGSGKTLAFALPMLDRLQRHAPSAAFRGPRGLIICPNRELVLQTLAVLQKLVSSFPRSSSNGQGGGSPLRLAHFVGGESMEEQTKLLHHPSTAPDIIVATPGRLLHFCDEQQVTLKAVEMIVLDEADRLLGAAGEVGNSKNEHSTGFEEQLGRILALVPASRQMALFSATIPTSHAFQAFSRKANLLPEKTITIRMDSGDGDNSDRGNHGQGRKWSLAPTLKTIFVSVLPGHKEALLLQLLTPSHLINLLQQHQLQAEGQSEDQSTKQSDTTDVDSKERCLVFTATKHHVEYLALLLNLHGIPTGALYGDLDQEARSTAIQELRAGSKRVLVVTDVAARGIDVPGLDFVINYDFPAGDRGPQGFVHRVGRVARQERRGCAITMVVPEEVPFFLDTTLALQNNIDATASKHDFELHRIALEEIEDALANPSASFNTQLEDLQRVAQNAYKAYRKSRPAASAPSHERARKLLATSNYFPLISLKKSLISPSASSSLSIISNKKRPQDCNQKLREQQQSSSQLLDGIRQYKPKKAAMLEQRR